MSEQNKARPTNSLPPYVVINIDKSSDARGMDSAVEIVQRDAMLNFFRHVSDSLQKARNYREFLMQGDMEDRLREHDTITVSGGRGTGKTTFILSMFKLLRTPEQLKLIPTASNISPYEIEDLGTLDPTLIEEKEHVFVHLLAKIKKKVDNAYQFGAERRDIRRKRHDDCSFSDNDICSPTADPCRQRTISDECYRDWQKLLKCLAAGLPSLDGVGGDDSHNSDKWHDPVYVMEKGLRNTAASNDLEIMFHRFVDKSLKLLNRTAFIIALDDIDTHFKRGWPVLEVLRKYLTTPQLITVLSGDLDLYSLLIRGKQWKNFDKELLNNEKGRKDYFHTVVDKLEQQYLLKLLKSDRRLELRSLYYLFEKTRTSNSYEVQIQLKDGTKLAVRNILSDIITRLFNVRGYDVDLYCGHLERETIRTMIRLVYADNNNKDLDSVKPIAEFKPLLDVFIDLFSVSLQQKGFDVHFLRDPEPRIVLNRLVMGLVKNGLLENGYRLRADFEDSEINEIIMVLGAIVNQLLVRHPSFFFTYMIKVGLTRQIALLYDSQEDVRRYLSWSGLEQGENAITISRQFTGFMRSYGKGTLKLSINHGTIALRRPLSKKNTKITADENSKIIKDRFKIDLDSETPFTSFKEQIHSGHPLYEFVGAINAEQLPPKKNADHNALYFNAAEELEERISSWHWRLVNLGLKRAVGRNNGTITYWSIHSFFAAFGALLDCRTEDEIQAALIRYSQIRDYPIPHIGEGELSKNRFESGEDDDTEQSVDEGIIPNTVIKELLNWSENAHGMLPAHIVAKIFSRMYYSLGRVDNDLHLSSRYFGTLIHRYIIIFLNAVLVEEALYKGIRQKINRNNPTGNDQVFEINLKNITSCLDELPFFNWMASCPLLGYFLNPNGKLHDVFTRFFPDAFDHEPVVYLQTVEYRNLYPLLNSVLVRNVKDDGKEDEVDDDGEQAQQPVSAGGFVKKTYPPKKPRYNKSMLSAVFKQNELSIKSHLSKWKYDPFIWTNEFIDKFLKPEFSGVSTKPEGNQYQLIQRRLLKFMEKK